MSRNLNRFFIYIFFMCAVIFNYAHANNEEFMTSHIQKIVLGSGCFWGAEKNYEELKGVIDAVSGYSDGYGLEPTYNEITKLKNKFNTKNYAEVVEVTYNTNIISTEMLLKYYFESHDPTQLNRQGNDIGTQYRSIILYSNKTQNKVTEKIISTYQELLIEANYGKIVTKVKPLKKFNKAETYHQNYIKKNQFIFHAGTKIVNNTIVSNGGRVLNIVTRSDDFKLARESSLELLKEVNWDNGFYRKDIGYKVIKE